MTAALKKEFMSPDAFKKSNVVVLGSTGSIGCNALDIIKSSNNYNVVALTAGRNVKLLAEQAVLCGAEYAVIADESQYLELKSLLSGSGIKALAGNAEVEMAATLNSDIIINGIVGFAGLKPSMAAIRSGRLLATANKESLVAAGHILVAEAKQNNTQIWPVDSEHNAIFQLIEKFGDDNAFEEISSITLTASGGPFRTWNEADIANATPAQAVKHPNWEMGPKISVDSATLMNKGLELIEAHYLFNLPHERINIVIHPESIVHGMAHYNNGSTHAQLSDPDMRVPIRYLLERSSKQKESSCRHNKLSTLTFEEVDEKRFPSINIARKALDNGPASCIAMNAANEVAVQKFLSGEIKFREIYDIVENTMANLPKLPTDTIEDIIEFDKYCRT